MQQQVFQSDEYGFPYDENTQKQIVDTNDSSSYDFIPEIPRLFLRSHIFGGSHLRDRRKALVYDQNLKNLVYKEITTPKLQERTFLEIVSNAIDNAFKSQRMGVPATRFDVTMNSDTISFRSTGLPVPVDIHKFFYSKGEFGTCAELIFGVIGAGGNTDDSIVKKGGGVNGYGAKLCNVFSRYFEVEIGDNIRGFHEKVIWIKNMTEKASVILTPSQYSISTPDQKGLYHIYPTGQKYTGENFVKITWKQDFRKFGTTTFSEEDMQLYMKYVIEASYIAKVKVSFNGIEFDCRAASKFITMLPKALTKNAMIHYELPQNITIKGKELEQAVINNQIVPNLEIIVLDTPGQDNMHISYCNGVCNFDGGVHTDEVYREVLKVIKQLIQDSKGYDKGIDLNKLNIKDIKNQCTVIINYKCDEAQFKGQDKEKLLKPTPKISFAADEVILIKKWNLVNAIYSIVTGKSLKNMTGDFKNRIIGDEDFRDAQWALDAKTKHNAVMLPCEGKSAGSYVKKWIYATPERTNKYASFFLKGKIKNVTDHGLFEILEKNKELEKFVNAMGFKLGVDYRTPEGFKTLRYGSIYIMVDADSDGAHILCLLMNFIYRFFQTFILAGRLFYVQTPVLRIFDKQGSACRRIFYNMCDYKAYVNSPECKKHVAKFFKGLASSNDTYAAQDALVSPIVYINHDDLAPQSFDIAFSKILSAVRKRWIEFRTDKIDTNILYPFPNNNNPRLLYTNITDYINTKLVEYSIDTFYRALPSYKDGLKKSQRQVLWHVLNTWNYGNSKKGEIKLGSIASAALDKTKYHHGSLIDTLARFGFDYPGSNNVALLTKEGQFGTREKLGKDTGAARYIETKTEDIVSLIFDKELTDLVEQNIVEDEKVEPKWLPCKIPLHIINGFRGLATGYSTYGPNYHPMDTIQWIINYINDQLCFPMIPWYKGFTGSVELEFNKGRYKKDKDLVIEGQVMMDYYEGLTIVTKGVYKVINERQVKYKKDVDGKKVDVTGLVKDIYVSEIPIDVASVKYKCIMDKRCDNVNDSYTKTTDTPIFILEGWKENVSEKDLSLINKDGLCNITLINDEGIPQSLRNVYEVLKMYCDNMKDLYMFLRNTRIKDIEEAIIKEKKTIYLIDLLINDKISTKKQDESYIEQQLLQHNIEFKIYQDLSRRSESKQGYEKHTKNLQELEAKYKIITDRHYLADWYDDLIKIYNFFKKDRSFDKLTHHQYPFIPTKIEDLISGKVKSPHKVPEINQIDIN
jgi:DNA topoisomerase-2